MGSGAVEESDEYTFLLCRNDCGNEVTVSRNKYKLLDRLFGSELDHVYAQENINSLLLVSGTPGLIESSVC